MKTIAMAGLSPAQIQGWLQSAVIPRPIAFASTINAAGQVNLSPFSFFNIFGTNPPVLVFSPSRRVRDNTIKHTLQNVKEVAEVVVHIGNYALAEQLSLSSSEYPDGVNEFIKAGFTAVPAHLVKPPLVQEAPVAMECRVQEIKPIGTEGGAANLVICEVLLMHVSPAVLNVAGTSIDPFKLDAVARLGGDWYNRVSANSIFKLPKPSAHLGIGFDQLPHNIRNNPDLTPNELARFAGLPHLPDVAFIQNTAQDPVVQYIAQKYQNSFSKQQHQLQKLAKNILANGLVAKAYAILFLSLKNQQ